MKILHLTVGLATGGTETTIYRLVSGMHRSIETTVISLTEQGTLGEKIAALAVPVYSLGMAQGIASMLRLVKLVRLIRSLGPQDLIQGWGYYGNLAALVAGALLPATPVLWNIRHTPYNLKHYKWMTATLIRLGAPLSNAPSRIVYNSKASMAYHAALGYSTARSVMIPNGFDLARFAPAAEARMGVRAELGIGHEAPLVGLVARFHPMKDHSNFLNAAAILIRKRKDVHFLLVGPGVSSSNLQLMRLIDGNAISAHTHLLGERRDIPRLVAAMDVASSSSWSEASPNVIGEAMACGVPCVVTDVGDSAWTVGETGLVVPPRDPQALANAWGRILDLSPKERRFLGAQARQRVEKYFSLASMIQAYEQLYEQIMQRRLKQEMNLSNGDAL